MKDVRPLKRQLREECLRRRDGIEPARREQMSREICDILTRLRSFETCDTLLTYVSFGSEVSTFPIIEYCFSVGKTVAVPKCEDRRKMEFYIITSFADLKRGKFDLLEPDPSKCRPVREFRNTFCLIPALSFDKYGNRLGYGGGFYDSFISDFPGTHIGLCFKECLMSELPSCRHDVKCDSILTEKGIILCRK
ncbi:MAG: 5-formyltetrahydrofolate cyclo-ligase [Clostridia bacterium]|nr:5-formyltetrahydrofolate cyclo-ligase [Clostridia bacterium]MBR5427944.1 5-formyltetrahydrofolate cyclo-ligase [Clostridia bacterium]